MTLVSARRATRIGLGLFFLVALAAAPSAQTAFINELHYDDVDVDDNEAVEIAVPTGTDVTTLRITLYNGNGGVPYGTAIDGVDFTAGATVDGYTLYSYVFPVNGLQNGSPDGIALSTTGGSLIQFLSYEGTITGVGGPADGATSEDIGVVEDNFMPEGQSLQLTGTGSEYDDFMWTGPATASLGQPNAGQTFNMGGGPMGTMLVVTTSADEDNTNSQCSLREAVRTANGEITGGDCGTGAADGDQITFAATVLLPITLSMGEITITDDVTIDGSSLLGRVTVDANGMSRIFDISADVDDVFFTSLILRNGNSGMGGSAAPDAGGAVDLKSGASATFTDVDVLNSIAGINGGGIHGGGDTDITITTSAGGSSLISGNDAQGPESNRGGGGVWGAGSVTVTGNVTIDSNVASGAAGSGGGVFNLGGTLVIGEGVTISNNTANRAGGGIESAGGTVRLTGTTISANDAGTAPGNGGGLHAGGAATVTVVDTEVSENTAVEGGGLWVSAAGTMTVRRTAVFENTASGASAEQGGGGLYSDGGTLIVQGSEIRNNVASGAAGSGGGILAFGGSLTVEGRTMIFGNTANRAGGGIEINAARPDAPGATVMIDDSWIYENNAGAAPGNGGGLHAGGAADLTFMTVRFASNTAVEGGGFWINGGGVLNASDLLVEDNEATGDDAEQGGGGFYNDGGRATIETARFRRNAASGAAGSGGGILNNMGMLTIRESEFAVNTANRAGGAIEDRAGAIPAGSMVSLIQVEMVRNDAGANPGNGGALHITGAGRVRVDSSMVNANIAANEGGGLWNSGLGLLDVSYTKITRNTATEGGGLYQQSGDEGSLIFKNGIVMFNAASAVGGGVAVDGGVVQIINSTITTNTADVGAGAASRGGHLLLSSATVAKNTATTSGGGLANLSPDFGDGDDSDDEDADPASLSPDNTIVADNAAPTGRELFGPVMSRGFNLFESTDGAMVEMDEAAGDDIVGVDPMLRPLSDNGGPTMTHGLRDDSPAINAGWTALTIDQRGAERRGTPDIGAFESDAAPTAGEDFATDFADGEEMRMSPASPNPMRDAAELTLAVRESQTVRVVLYDVMGRQVSVLHDGPMVASTAYDLTVNARGLASGVYVVVVRGESIQGTQQITVAR